MQFHWGKAIFIFFIIFLSLAAIFIVFSFRQNNDLVEKDYYNKGANYTETMLIKQRSEQYIDSISMKQKGSDLFLYVSEELMKNSANIRIHFYFPSNEQHDFHISSDSFIENMFIATQEEAKGRYIAKLSWQMDSLQYYIEKPIYIQ